MFLLPPPSDAQLNRLLYDHETGQLLWTKTLEPVGYICGRYKRFYLDGKAYYVHKIIWCILTGQWIEVDHKDRNGLNNKITNLRPCTRSENMFNAETPKNNTSGHKGVIWDNKRKKWKARIKFRRKDVLLGRFDSYEDAVTARLNAEVKFAGEFSTLPAPTKDQL